MVERVPYRINRLRLHHVKAWVVHSLWQMPQPGGKWMGCVIDHIHFDAQHDRYAIYVQVPDNDDRGAGGGIDLEDYE